MFRNRILIVMTVAALAVFAVACEREADVTDTAIVDTAITNTAAVDTNIVTPAEVRSLGWGAWHDWDVDADKLVKREEFNQRFGTVYTGWAGTDNTLTADEAADTWRDWFDTNNDDIIDTDEWNVGVANWNLPDYNWGTYETWDVDRDARVTADEWRTGFRNVRPNATWTRDEMADTWWDWWDTNDDDIIDENEWRTRSAYWGTPTV